MEAPKLSATISFLTRLDHVQFHVSFSFKAINLFMRTSLDFNLSYLSTRPPLQPLGDSSHFQSIGEMITFSSDKIRPRFHTFGFEADMPHEVFDSSPLIDYPIPLPGKPWFDLNAKEGTPCDSCPMTMQSNLSLDRLKSLICHTQSQVS